MAQKKRSKFTDEEHQFILDNVEGMTYSQLSYLMFKKLRSKRTATSISNYCSRNGISNNIHSHKGQFASGHIPPATLPIGTERIDYRGDVFVKVSIRGKEREKGKHKKVIEWKKHGGSLNDDDIIIFLDGNRKNFDIDNLLPIPRKVFLYLTREQLLTEHREINLAIINYANLMFLRRERERELKR